MKLAFKGDLAQMVKSSNIFTMMDKDDIKTISLRCLEGLNRDKESRAPWELWYKTAMELALQVATKKSFPWAGASNVKFPLITIAAINWHAKAYPATISGESVVRCRVLGPDPDGAKMSRAVRVGKYISYRLLEDSPWEEQTDKSLLVLPIMGSVFKKTVRSDGYNCSDMVMPQDLVVNYWTSAMDNAIRATHLFKKTPNEMYQAQINEIYLEKGSITQDSPTPMQQAKNRAQHVTEPSEKEVYSLAEQSCWLDLDGDGYEEPYAVTFDENDGTPYRLLARYFSSDIKKNDKGKVICIDPENYYTKFEFIPSPDGGFYGLGLGVLLGPLNESVNSAINQIFDGSTMSTLGGGFLGRGVKIKGGDATFKPFEWKTVDSTGDGLAKNIFPLPVREPSMMLLELVKFLVQYGQQVGGAGDIEMGDIPGQNVKAGAMSIAAQKGEKIFKATYKRFWRGLKEEFKKLYELEQVYGLDSDDAAIFQVTADDFSEDSSGIIPAADPNIVSDDERRQLAVMLTQRATAVPGYDPIEVEKRFLAAFNVEGGEALYKGPPPNPPPSPEMMKIQLQAQELQMKGQDSMRQYQLDGSRLMMDAQRLEAEIEEMRARSYMEYKKGEGADVGHFIALMDIQIAAKKNMLDQVMGQHDRLLKSIDMMHTFLGGKNGDGLGLKRGDAEALASATAATLPSMEKPAGDGAVLQ